MYDTEKEALADSIFDLDRDWLPRMLCERHDGKYEWVSLGSYEGRNRGSMTEKERKEALAKAPLIGNYDLEKGHKVCDYKRGILIQDFRKPI